MARQGTTSGTQKATSKRAGAGARRSGAGTGARDEHYDVVSVLYHALQGAETIQRYMEDAREAQDEELLEFFEETRAAYADRAAQAKQLLADRIESSGNGTAEEEEEEDEEED